MLAKTYHSIARQSKQPLNAGLMAILIAMTNVGVSPSQAAVAINTSPIGSGFTVTEADLAYILKQIKIAEYHAANTTSQTGPCGALVGTGPNQIASPLLSFGLRTVDGTCNNLQPDQENFGAADQPFVRLTTPEFKPAENATAFRGPLDSSYAQETGSVVDSQPRLISNLIVDQTSSNPAAIHVSGNPSRTQGNTGVVPCATEPTSIGANDGVPAGCVPAHETLFIPNVTTDVGLSPPYNSLFTIFGQFFDHGLDKITTGGAGTVFVTLKADDPLVAGPDHVFGNADDLSLGLRFMAVTRGSIVPSADGFRNAPNTDTPFVDQSQTYTSHGSHQVFMREYALVAGKPVATGKFLSDADGGMPTWAMIKEQAATKLGIRLVDVDVNNIPLIATDPYGNFIPGLNGLPQIAISSGTGLVEGDLTTPVAVPQDGVRINTAFLNDIAHSAGPGSIATPKTPDANTAAGGSLDPAASGEYDNELLDLHFICGDGRCNENIGLTAIHQTFHMEHDRLVDYFNNPTTGVLTRPENAALLAEYMRVNLTPANPGDKTFTYSERLFQAARFINEMQYQHLVFEEFARKIQPAIPPFPVFAFNQTDINPAITAEFAHAVYRFGHSMLNESIPRVNPASVVIQGAPLHNDISLLDGFLNPAEFFNGGGDFKLTTRQAVSSLIMGLSDQVGNELDEFVTEVLRNHLLGLPLDLASINIARARSEGVPSLNKVRKQLWAATNDTQLTPYANWVDFNENIKNPVSLVNFIAAYGKHPDILAATTLADKRAVADQIVNGTVRTVDGLQIQPPADSANFMFSISAWEDVAGVSQTGLDDIDLWMGGLAEKTNVFGGLLGSTFNYVFEKQLSDLQLGDRFYYLARTPGMNLRTQLEGNSFSELIMRNTSPDTHTLKADSFATADCKFQLANLNGTAAGFLALGSFVADDPTSECDESKLLIRFPDGAIKYRSSNLIDPAGINAQAVFNGTDFADYIAGGNDNDTFWGGLGNDNIEGNGGDDFILGGDGNDILTDSAGFDFLKGGPGNDAMDAGIDDDILVGGDGQDFMNGGGNNDALFGGPGDDFMLGGQGADVNIGDSGDDWIQGGEMTDLLIGDSSTFFFDDHNRPGHDILIGQGGDDDYDMEGGDDIAVAGPGVEKNAGAAGYDWSIGLGDPQPQDADLAQKLVEIIPLNEVRSGFNEVEALSGWKFNDTLRGDSVIPSQNAGLDILGCNVLDQAGLNRIAGLDELVPPLTVDSAPVIANALTNYCELVGPVWGEGNILLGGGGSDTLEGRGANDILDGDKYLNVRLSVRAGVDVNGKATGEELGSTGLMETLPVSGNFGLGTTGMTLQQAVFSGRVNPGQIVAVREILNGGLPGDSDTALFSGPAAGYSIIINVDGSVTVRDNNVVARDGTDTLWNMEKLSFCDVPDPAVQGACITRAAPISIVPLAVVSPASLAFGNQIINTTSVSRPFTVSNTGLKPLTLGSIGVAPATDFGIATDGTTCTATTVLITGSSCTVNAQFSPTSDGAKSASVSIVSDTSGSPISVSLTSTGVLPIPPTVPSAFADQFNRLNANTLSSTWQQNILFGTAVLRVNLKMATANRFGATGSAYFNIEGAATQGAGFTFANAKVNNTALYLKATGGMGGTSGQLQNAIRVLYNNGSVTVSTTTTGNGLATYNTAGVISTIGVLTNGNSLKAVVDGDGKVWVWKVVGTTTTLLTPFGGVKLPINPLWTTGTGKVGMSLPHSSMVDNFIKM